ncbi:Tyrosine-protein phosphatase YwqE [Ekhidna lutea]|uniref:protein-tyrosine-phosphatase n=1 Tax=Ekhidna lutea TaxID=447679 RepID=A0A239KGQ5_EKHLU|nr:CpsB/CapC family capsule biosynthesis tyrosine phosphatase [Ekhidna lutea]SNT16878.1 Tyrosine-protein phosphatase YwqE [Ekhidna lutea]
MALFGKKKIHPLSVDIHSHLIPNIDDGSQSMDQSINMIRELAALGINKVVTTPHIHPRYPNTPEVIMIGLKRLQEELKRCDVEMEVEAAAEYYVDENFIAKVKARDTLLSFGDNMILVEAPFQNKPIYFESAMFDLMAIGLQPVLAHPERYQFLEGSINWLEELKEIGVMFQITLGSIGGYYGAVPQKLGKYLIKLGLVDFLGSDLHRQAHIPFMKKGLESSEIQKLIKNGSLKNQELL